MVGPKLAPFIDVLPARTARKVSLRPAPTVGPRLAPKAGRRFVANTLANLPEGDHTDPAMAGLQLRVRGAARTWKYRTRFKGKWLRVTIGHLSTMSLADARDEARRMAGYVEQGIDPRSARSKGRRKAVPLPSSIAVAVKAGPHSIETLCREFMERFVQPRRKRPEAVQYMLDHDVLPVWRGRDARTIKAREVIELLDGIVERGAPVQANRVAGIVSQLFRFGVHRALVDTSPVQLLYRPGGTERPRARVLSDDELATFLKDPQDCTRFERLSHVMMILLLTGQRRGELSLARWEHVDLNAKEWTVPPEHSKTGRGHVVPLSDWAVREFEALHRERDGSAYVLPGANGQPIVAKLLTRAMARCQKRFQKRDVAQFTLHDLRRTCRTGLARLGIQPHIAERVLNHAQERIPSTYDVHNYLVEKRDALEKWTAHLLALKVAAK
jgi:integrase